MESYTATWNPKTSSSITRVNEILMFPHGRPEINNARVIYKFLVLYNSITEFITLLHEINDPH